MRHASLYGAGGNGLIVGGILLAVAVLIHAPQPETLADAAALSAGRWALSHWMIAIGAVALAAGAVALARHFAGGPGEGLTVLGLAAVALSTAAFLIVGAIEAVGFALLVQMGGGEMATAASHAFLALNASVLGLIMVAGPVFWIGFAAFGLAMAKDAAFASWLGYAAVAVAAIEIVAQYAVTNQMIAQAVMVLGSLWFVLAGNALARAGREAPAPAGAAAGA